MSAIRSLTPSFNVVCHRDESATQLVGPRLRRLQFGDHLRCGIGVQQCTDFRLQREAQMVGDGQQVQGHQQYVIVVEQQAKR